MVKKAGERPKIVADTRKRRAADEAAIENAWKVSGDLHVIANRLGMCRLRNEPPPAWVHKALLDLASMSVDIKPYAKEARSLVRYVAVREAHDRDGVSWKEAKHRAAERLRGQPAEATAETMWNEYKKVRKALRALVSPALVSLTFSSWTTTTPDIVGSICRTKLRGNFSAQKIP